MWSTEGGGSVHSKNRLVSSRQHRAMEVRKLRFLSSCQYTTGVARRLLGPHDTLPCVLITVFTDEAVIEYLQDNQGNLLYQLRLLDAPRNILVHTSMKP